MYLGVYTSPLPVRLVRVVKQWFTSRTTRTFRETMVLRVVQFVNCISLEGLRAIYKSTTRTTRTTRTFRETMVLRVVQFVNCISLEGLRAIYKSTTRTTGTSRTSRETMVYDSYSS